MYLKEIEYCNVGPLESVKIIPAIIENNPKPLILVGENGSGKSTFLSNIIDSFYEIAGIAFSNVRQANEDTTNGYQYFKALSTYQITVGKKYLYSHIVYQHQNKEIEYIFKSGELKVSDFNTYCHVRNASGINWNTVGNYKHSFATQSDVEGIFETDVICYFGPSRYEKSVWMGNKYYEISQQEHISINELWNGLLRNSISAMATTDANLQWLLDVIVDSRPDVVINGSNISLDGNIEDLDLLSQARQNIEKIMSSIIGCEIKFELNYRNRGADRFMIVKKDDGKVIVPTLNSLSTGQLALFNLFATIVRYADTNDINKSIRLEEITGIVLIDEIELHLHSIMQKEILPKLLKLFPKIQFIITTHAPLFVLGMEQEFGKDAYDMYELPNADKISVDRFSEFNRAYSYYADTARYEAEMRSAIDENKRTIIITEGATDWKHIKAAYNKLKNVSEYKEIFENLEFDILEYEPANSKTEAKYKFEMGWSALISMCSSYAKMPNSRKLIFIADRDVPNANKELSEPGKNFKKWGNNVYSFILPLPENRKDTPGICIEHLYTDEEIKTEYIENEIPRRLFIGNEFDERGISFELDRYCIKKDLCGPNKISIIEGSSKERVTGLQDNTDINYGLSKMKFAENVLGEVEEFSGFDFREFVPIFKTIKEICDDVE